MTKVLIVDDSLMDRNIAGKCAEEEELIPLFAEDGRQALQMVAAESPDAVVTDLQMPEMDGLELVRELHRQYPLMPVVLMTAFGSEEVAVTALKSGASSYVPKRNLKRDLGQTLRIVLDVARVKQDRRSVYDFMRDNRMEFVLDYRTSGPGALVGYLQDSMLDMDLCTQSEMVRIGTALTEALANAIDHGNLELDSELREQDDHTYRDLADERKAQSPYKDRRVFVSVRFQSDEAEFVIRDEGPGFDHTDLPDPLDPENMLRASGRGLLLIQAFMDEVRFNDAGNEITLIKRRTAV